MNSPHKGQWRGALMFSLIFAWINGWVNNREAGDLRRHRAHYDVTVMTGDRWIPRTKVQYREKCFHLITSSCQLIIGHKQVQKNKTSILNFWNMLFMVPRIQINSKKSDYFGTKFETKRRIGLPTTSLDHAFVKPLFVGCVYSCLNTTNSYRPYLRFVSNFVPRKYSLTDASITQNKAWSKVLNDHQIGNL